MPALIGGVSSGQTLVIALRRSDQILRREFDAGPTWPASDGGERRLVGQNSRSTLEFEGFSFVRVALM